MGLTTATMNAQFDLGITPGQAWDSLAATFGKHKASLLPGGYTLIPDSEGGVRAGATFSVLDNAHLEDTLLEITRWEPPRSLAYITTHSGGTATMHFEIAESQGRLTLVVHRSERRTGLMAIIGRLFNLTKGAAYGTLDSLVAPASRNATAWAGVWKALPIHQSEIELS
jgi:hypothetical protein